MKVQRHEAREWSRGLRDWFYHPGYVVSTDPADGMGFHSVDCPMVIQIPGKQGWFMFYTGFDGNGYQTMAAHSMDLVQWEPMGLAMGYGKPGCYDHGGVTFGGALLESYDVKAPRLLRKHEGRYWALYGCYPRQGGYEPRPGAEGLAWSRDGLAWERSSECEPVLSVNGAGEWEKDCIYQPWLMEFDGAFHNFYNAANGHLEQTGLAVSDNLTDWRRHPGNPVVRNGPAGSCDETFCSDPKVYRDGDHWIMLYFGVNGDGAHIMAAYSRDLLDWTKDPEPLYRAGGHPLGLDARYAHKVSLVYRADNDTLYMFYTAVGVLGRGIALLTSKPV